VAAGDLTTLASVREFLRLSDATQTDMDALLTTFVGQASKAIHRHTGREFAPLSTASQTRIFAYHGGGRLYFSPYDLRAATSVQIDTDGDSPTTLTADSDYFLFPRNANDGVYEWMELRGFEPSARASNNALKPWREVTIIGTWGFDAVPADVKTAANMLIAFWYRQHSALSGVDLAGEGDRFGPVTWPTAVRQLLDPYRVVGFGLGG
jgi:uncharacterized phiE125 gp8 family phage protein